MRAYTLTLDFMRFLASWATPPDLRMVADGVKRMDSDMASCCCDTQHPSYTQRTTLRAPHKHTTWENVSN